MWEQFFIWPINNQSRPPFLTFPPHPCRSPPPSAPVVPVLYAKVPKEERLLLLEIEDLQLAKTISTSGDPLLKDLLKLVHFTFKLLAPASFPLGYHPYRNDPDMYSGSIDVQEFLLDPHEKGQQQVMRLHIFQMTCPPHHSFHNIFHTPPIRPSLASFLAACLAASPPMLEQTFLALVPARAITNSSFTLCETGLTGMIWCVQLWFWEFVGGTLCLLSTIPTNNASDNACIHVECSAHPFLAGDRGHCGACEDVWQGALG